MADLTEIDDLEPLFDYHRVQPHNLVSLDDDDTPPISIPKRRKTCNPAVENEVEVETREVQVVNCDEEEEDWLPPPPKVLVDNQLGEDSAIKELRLKKQELVSFAKSAEDMLRAVEESVKTKHSSVQAPVEAEAEKASKPPCERAKIVISVQDKDGLKQFRVYKDEKFERLFKMYADKVKLDKEKLVFCFDGDKIGPAATPASLGMDDDDIIEVHVKKS
ncbi:Small ubiquitin-related modifier like [Melia azedarach]|uniref:Small ubiquitin-related modifier like n=1 Tax=Melia azedarach TaxID=155640 RepID=A0ACC1XF81_MELAZ|nr:Small ubiquitin-related modifier like [Melia azedarach]